MSPSVARAVATGRCEILPGVTVTRLIGRCRPGVAHRVARCKRAAHRLPVKRLAPSAAPSRHRDCCWRQAANRHSHGLANDSGMVGRYFMETLAGSVRASSTHRCRVSRDRPPTASAGITTPPTRYPAFTAAAGFPPPYNEAALNGPIAYAQRVVPGWEAGTSDDAQADRAGAVGRRHRRIPAEQRQLHRPRPAAEGTPGARRWPAFIRGLASREIWRLRFMATLCRKLLHAAGASELIEGMAPPISSFDACLRRLPHGQIGRRFGR